MRSSRQRRRAARVIVLDPSDRILLINAQDPARRDRRGWWEIPGGGIDPHETSEDAARRELWEEAGIADAEIGPCVWTQSVEFTFAGWRFEQDEWVHIARFDGVAEQPQGLEALEAMAFGEQRWWTVPEVVGQPLRTIPYRLAEFLPAVLEQPFGTSLGSARIDPIDITPDPHHVEAWHRPD